VIGTSAPRRDPRFAHFEPIPPQRTQAPSAAPLSTLERRRLQRQLVQTMLSGGQSRQ
jgi:hypothetical protein